MVANQIQIEFKILLLAYKALNGEGPAYLQELLTRKEEARHTRSSNRFTLSVPLTKRKTHGDIAFSAAAPRLWNKLPEELKHAKCTESFKKHLKTHLFTKSVLERT